MTVTEPGRPRRRAARSRRPVVSRTGVGAVLLVLVAGLAVLATEAARPADEPARQAATEQVTRTLLACPAKATARDASTTLVAGSAPSPDLGDTGSVRHGPPGGPWQEAKLARGRLDDLGRQGRDSMALDGRGELAAGLFGFRGDTGPAGTSAFASCSPPRADWWFTGTGATIDHSSELLMTNVDPGPAVVDVRLFGPDGEPDAVGTRGITVPPGESVAMPLADVVPQSDDLAMNVRASRGRVVAAVSDSFAQEQGGRPGHDWVPDQTGPTRVVQIAGLPQRADRVTLVVGNPSSLEAVVDVEVAGAAGSFRPVGLDQLQVSPGTVRTVDVTQFLGKDPSALRLRSRVPIVASARAVVGGDSSYGAAVTPLTGTAVVPVARRGDSTVLLTAGAGAARARLTTYDAQGKQARQTELDVPPGATRAWSATAGAYLVVTPLRGAVSGATSYTGDGLASLPLVDLPIELRRPVVLPALS